MADSRLWLGVIAGGAALMSSTLYTLDAREIAVLTTFGAPVSAVLEPGLHLKAPWPVQAVVRFDARRRVLTVPATETLTRDKKNLVLEVFAVWRVSDPQRFLEALGGIDVAEGQLTDLVQSRVSAAIGKLEFQDLLAVGDPAAPAELLPAEVLTDVAAIAQSRLGIAVEDLRLRHLGLPLQNEQSIYERMRAERTRIANAYRSEGEEQATAIRAQADRQAAELLAAAERDAGLVMAGAERAVAATYAEAYRQDPALFQLWTAMEAYSAALGEDDTLVLSTNSPFFEAMSPPAAR